MIITQETLWDLKRFVEDVNDHILNEMLAPSYKLGVLCSAGDIKLVELVTDGTTVAIKMMGNTLWDSDNDDRPYVISDDENEERQIPVQEYLLAEIKEVLLVASRALQSLNTFDLVIPERD